MPFQVPCVDPLPAPGKSPSASPQVDVNVRCAQIGDVVEITGKAIRLAPDLVEATQDTQPFVLYSSCLKSLAIKLSKICNDLRLLSSGPRAGINEINLPRMQPGSSIMPGKVNPVMAEMLDMVCFQVIGNELCVNMAAQAGQLQQGEVRVRVVGDQVRA